MIKNIKELSPRAIEREKNEYAALINRLRGVQLLEYENSVVHARTILDAASEEDTGEYSSRLHILAVISRGSRVSVAQRDDTTTCKVVLVKKHRGVKRPNDEGTCDIYDPTGEIYKNATVALEYVTYLHKKYGKP